MLEIDLNAIKKNWQNACAKTGVDVAGVLKANAYGMGADEVGRTLQKAGCKTFFVMTAAEGIKLRETLGKEKIYILQGPLKETVKDLEKNNLTPVINSKEQALLWKNGKSCAVHLYTGMRRFSMPESEWNWMQENLADYNIDMLMSHLASADDKKDELNKIQLENFKALTEKFGGKITRSLMASEYETQGEKFYFDRIRLGYGLYGGFGGTPAVKWSAKIRQVTETKKGDRVGYNGTYKFKKDGKLAAAFIGYADGLVRMSQANGLYGYIGGYKVPLVGRVSMDISTFDISDVPDKILETEKSIELIGPHVTLDDIAKSMGTIGYEVLTNLRSRDERVYK